MTQRKYYDLVCENMVHKKGGLHKRGCGYRYQRYVCLHEGCYAEPENECIKCHAIKAHKFTKRNWSALPVEFVHRGQTAYGNKKTMVCWHCGAAFDGLSKFQLAAYIKARLYGWTTSNIAKVCRVERRHARRLKKPKITHCPKCNNRLVPTDFEFWCFTMRARPRPRWSYQKIADVANGTGGGAGDEKMTRYKIKKILDHYAGAFRYDLRTVVFEPQKIKTKEIIVSPQEGETLHEPPEVRRQAKPKHPMTGYAFQREETDDD